VFAGKNRHTRVLGPSSSIFLCILILEQEQASSLSCRIIWSVGIISGKNGNLLHKQNRYNSETVIFSVSITTLKRI